MVAKKRKSKRQTLQTKYKIQKRSKEHRKRVKKGVIVNAGKKKKVDNHIPNAWPYKEDLLREIQAAKDSMEVEQARQKELKAEEMVSYLLDLVVAAPFISAF
jgi:nuclear GTP-binding protein